MARQFNEEREKLSKKWQDESVRFVKEILNNKNLSLEQSEAKKC